MKNKAYIYNLDNPNPIGEVEATSITMLKNVARWYAGNFNGCSKRVKIEDQKTGRVCFVNS